MSYLLGRKIFVPIEKAIQSSDIGVQPYLGEVIRVILPDLTEETGRELIKAAKSEAENSKLFYQKSKKRR